jgi:hypothetical protein
MILSLVQDSTEWCSEVGEDLERIWMAVVVAGLRSYPTVCMEWLRKTMIILSLNTQFLDQYLNLRPFSEDTWVLPPWPWHLFVPLHSIIAYFKNKLWEGDQCCNMLDHSMCNLVVTLHAHTDLFIAENCAVLGYYATNGADSFPTFQDSLSVHLQGSRIQFLTLEAGRWDS